MYFNTNLVWIHYQELRNFCWLDIGSILTLSSSTNRLSIISMKMRIYEHLWLHLRLTHIYIQTEALTLSGKPEEIKVCLFEMVNYNRQITDKGKLIMIYDSKAEENTAPYWEHESIFEEKTGKVPTGFKVHMIGAMVKFI